MNLVVLPDGAVRCLYTEDLELSALGTLSITRASHVEPDENGQWFADLSPVNGPMLGPFTKRRDALVAEIVWLEANRLG